MTRRRYAAYWAPPELHALWEAGCAWLGRDAQHPRAVRRAACEQTSQPRRYGFHATLKAPFELREGCSEACFVGAVEAIAATMESFEMPPLVVDTLTDFVALRPRQPIGAAHPLRRLADACVRELDGLRRPLTAADADRRLAAMRHDGPGRAHLERWGYPHVFDAWRFHMTLSDSLPDAAERERVADQAREFFAASLMQPLACDAVSIFVEPAPGLPFEWTCRVALKTP